jgi:hypothetical protein
MLPGQGAESSAYGFLPPGFFRIVRDRFLAADSRKKAALVKRTEQGTFTGDTYDIDCSKVSDSARWANPSNGNRQSDGGSERLRDTHF